MLMLPQSSVFCCIFWPEATLQGTPSGSDIHLFSLEICAFKIFSVMFILPCSYKEVNFFSKQQPYGVLKHLSGDQNQNINISK